MTTQSMMHSGHDFDKIVDYQYSRIQVSKGFPFPKIEDVSQMVRRYSRTVGGWDAAFGGTGKDGRGVLRTVNAPVIRHQ